MSFTAMGTITATVLVTKDPDRSGNFVADGVVTDDIVLNRATIYAAAIGGGEVVAGHGAWALVATVNVPVGILFRGMGWTTIFNYDAGGNCITFTGDNAKVRDLKIVIVAGAGGAGTRPNGIYASGRTNIEVSGVWIVGDQTEAYDGSLMRQNGIFFSTTTGSRIKDCICENHESFGINLTVSSDDNRVSNNTCKGNLVGGLVVDASRDNTITGNTCTGNEIGLYLATTSDHNTIVGNTCQGNSDHGIQLSASDNNTIVGNTCQGNLNHGIYMISISAKNSVVGNTCQGNILSGIFMSDRCNNNSIVGNTCEGNNDQGIYLILNNDNNNISGNICYNNRRNGIKIDDSDNNTVVGNSCNENDRIGNTYSGINITDTSSDNIIHSNTCNGNDKYGIDIDDANALRNWVKNNILRGNTTGAFNDGGTDTKLATIQVPFIQGSTFISADGSAKGWEINAEADMAVALGQLPLEVQQVVRVKIWAVALGAPAGAGGQMHLDVVIQAGADNLAYTTENIALADFDSVTTDYVNTDVVHWSIDSGDDADIADLVGGMSFECKINGAVAAAPDGATNATFRVCMVEVV